MLYFPPTSLICPGPSHPRTLKGGPRLSTTRLVSALVGRLSSISGAVALERALPRTFVKPMLS